MQHFLRFAIAVVCACNSKPASPISTASGSSASPPTPAPASGSNVFADSPRALRDKIVGVNAHVDVLKTVSDFAEYRDVLGVVEHTENVVAAEPFIFVELYIASASHAPIGVALKGVDPKRVASVLDLGAHMKVGKIGDLATGELPSLILGDVLAQTLEVGAGDRVTLTLPQIDPKQKTEPQHEHVFRVTGTFHIGFDEYDERLTFASLAAVQNLVNRGDQVMGIELKVKDIEQSDKVARSIEHALGGSPYRVMDWYELNRSLFTTLFGERRP